MSSPSFHPPQPTTALKGAAWLCVLTMSLHAVLTSSRVAVMLAGLNLGLSTFEVGILVAVFAMLPMMFSVKAGRMIDASGPWKPMYLSSGVVLAGSVIPFIWLDMISLIACAILVGIGQMVFQVAALGQLGRGTNEERVKHFSWLPLALSLSGTVGPLVAGLSIDHLGHRSTFALCALPAIITLAGLYRIREQLQSAPRQQPQKDTKLKVTDLLEITPLKKVFIANLLIAGAWDTHMFIVPIYGVEIGLSATTIGVILSFFGIATLLIRMVLPFIQQRAHPWHFIHASMAATTIIFVLYPFTSQVWLLTALSFALGLALGMTQTSVLSLLQQHSPAGRASEAFGFRMALINGSQVTLPVGFGALGAVFGVMPLFWAAAIALVSGIWATRDASRPPSNPTSHSDPS